MDNNRLKLHEILVEILGCGNVYFQPPSSINMQYPAIVYNRKRIDNKHANNDVYNHQYLYEITVIDEDPDSNIVNLISKLPTCKHDRHFTSDNLNHDTFTIMNI